VKRKAARTRHAHARPAPRPVGLAILTVSDTRRGADDLSGDALGRLFADAGHRVAKRAWSADSITAIRRATRALRGRRDVDVVVVTGGTGIAPRDVTPEALAPLLDKALPGFGERFRSLSAGEVGGAAWLSRAVAGVARGRLVVALPGSIRAVELGAKELLIPELGHAVRLLGRFREGA